MPSTGDGRAGAAALPPPVASALGSGREGAEEAGSALVEQVGGGKGVGGECKAGPCQRVSLGCPKAEG